MGRIYYLKLSGKIIRDLVIRRAHSRREFGKAKVYKP